MCESMAQTSIELLGLREVVNSVGAYIFTKDMVGRYTYANNLVCELFGVSLQEIIGRDDSDFFDLKVSNELRINDRRVTERGEKIELEERTIVKPSGETRYYWTIKAPIRNSGGEIVGMCGISTDITERKLLEKSLAEQRDLSNAILNNIEALVYMKSWDRKFIYGNSEMAKLMGVESKDISGQLDTELMDSAVADYFWEKDSKVIENGEKFAGEEIFYDQKGNAIHYWAVKIPVKQSDGSDALVGFSTNITKLRNAEKELLEVHERYERMIENVAKEYCFYSRDARGHVSYVSSSFTKMLGWHPSKGENTLQELLTDNPINKEAMKLAALGLKGERQLPFLIELHHEDGSKRLCEINETPLFDDAGNVTGLDGVVHDVTEQKKLEQELERRAHIDYLTGLSNRGYFIELAEREMSRTIRYKHPMSFLMLDIDNFKKINDTYGHKAGDDVLRILAQVCSKTLRSVDISSRLGGEEFAFILPETPQQVALDVAERLRLALSAAQVPIAGGETVLCFTVSIGLTSLNGEKDSLDDLMSRADKALYRAKNSGKDRVCVAQL